MKNIYYYDQNSLVFQNNRMRKIAWTIFFLLLTSIILIIYQTYPVSLTRDVPSVMQIPLVFWILCTLALVVWVKLFLYQNNPKYLIIGVVTYYFIFFCSNLMFVSPYEQTDRISSFISNLDNNAFINQDHFSNDNYLQWPIFFFFTKIFLLVGDLTLNQILQIGFFSINLILPVILLFMYNSRSEGCDRNYILPVIIYILISYSFIVNQYAPQALALLFLFLTYAIFYRVTKSKCEKKSIKLGILFISFTALVFTHPFMFIFFLAPLMIDYIYKACFNKNEVVSLSGRTIILFTIIYFAGLLYRYVSIQNQLVTFVNLFGSKEGETWSFLITLLNTDSSNQVTPSYFPILETEHFILSNILKLILLLIIIMLTFIIIKYSHSRKFITSFDFSIMLTSIVLYVVGLFSFFLGQRGIQVVTSSLVQPYKTNLNRYKNTLLFILLITLIMTPAITVATSLTNIARSGEAFIEDQEMNVAGHYLDVKIPNDTVVIMSESMYPISRPPEGFSRFSNLNEINEKQLFIKTDYVFITPKFVLQAKYFGYDYMLNTGDFNRVYSNGETMLEYSNN